MFIIVYTSSLEGDVETTVESTSHKTYRAAQTKCREIIKEKIEEEDYEQSDFNDMTDHITNACIYMEGEDGDSMYKILEV